MFLGSFRGEREVETAIIARGFPIRPDIVAGTVFPNYEEVGITEAGGGDCE